MENEHLSRTISMTNYKENDLLGHVTLQPLK